MSRHAYVTLVTNADYAKGAVALVRSLKRTGTEADIVAMHTGGVASEALAPLGALGVRLLAVDLLPTSAAFDERHARGRLHDAAPFTKGEKPRFHTPLDNFAKLRLWQMTEYERIVFLDADTLVLDRLGNTAAAGAIVAMKENHADLKPGDYGLLCAFGAGYSIGGALMRMM